MLALLSLLSSALALWLWYGLSRQQGAGGGPQQQQQQQQPQRRVGAGSGTPASARGFAPTAAATLLGLYIGTAVWLGRAVGVTESLAVRGDVCASEMWGVGRGSLVMRLHALPLLPLHTHNHSPKKKMPQPPNEKQNKTNKQNNQHQAYDRLRSGSIDLPLYVTVPLAMLAGACLSCLPACLSDAPRP